MLVLSKADLVIIISNVAWYSRNDIPKNNDLALSNNHVHLYPYPSLLKTIVGNRFPDCLHVFLERNVMEYAIPYILRLILFCFPSFRFWEYLMKVILETRHRTKFDIYVFITTHTKSVAILIKTVFHHFKMQITIL